MLKTTRNNIWDDIDDPLSTCPEGNTHTHTTSRRLECLTSTYSKPTCSTSLMSKEQTLFKLFNTHSFLNNLKFESCIRTKLVLVQFTHELSLKRYEIIDGIFSIISNDENFVFG